MRHVLPAAVIVMFLAGGPTPYAARADEPIFSGPQVGERLLPLKVSLALDEAAGEEFDPVAKADGKPLVLIFVHEANRPSISVTRTVIDYSKKRAEDGLAASVIFLADDATETEAFIRRASHALPTGVPLGVSLDGQEGPGTYGLNRNVTLTVLVAKDNRVTANFALVQPSLAQDAPEIGHAIVQVLGGEKKPTLAEMGGEQAAMMQRREGGTVQRSETAADARFASLLRPLINQDATSEQVGQAAKKVEELAAKDEAFRKRVAEAVNGIIKADRLENYGTPAAQAYLKKWAKEFAKPAAASDEDTKTD